MRHWKNVCHVGLSRQNWSPQNRSGRTNFGISLTPAQNYSFGKRAAENGTTATLRCYAKTYPDLPLKEMIVRRFKNNYQLSLEIASDGSSDASEPLTIYVASTANEYILFSGSRDI